MNSLLKMEIFLKRYQSVKQKEKMANLKFLENVLCSPYNFIIFFYDLYVFCNFNFHLQSIFLLYFQSLT